MAVLPLITLITLTHLISIAIAANQLGNVVDMINYDSVANIKVLKGGLLQLPTLLNEVTNSPSMHKIIIEADAIGTEAIFDHDLGTLLDAFLMTAPWWVISKESYNHINIDTHTNVNGVRDILTNSHMIVLHRFHRPYELHLRRLAAVQFPPSQAICDHTPLYIGRMINSGWGSQILFALQRQNAPFGVFNVWYSLNNQASESMQTCHAKDCAPGIVNKWECVFLPLTNCSMEKVAFTQCHTPQFPKKSDCFPMDYFTVRNMSASGGEMIPWDNELAKVPTNDFQLTIDQRFPLPGTDPEGTDTGGNGENTGEIPNARFIYAHDTVTTRPVSRELNFYMFGSIFRPNYNLRRRTKIVLDDMMISKQIPFRVGVEECIAIHIRRGDRMVDTTSSNMNSHQKSIGMKEYCSVLTAGGMVGRDNCTQDALDAVTKHWAYGSNDCQGLSDFGCWDARTFGELTLVDYLQKAKVLLPHITNAFVMSDDGPWLQREITSLPNTGKEGILDVSGYNVGMLPAAENSRAAGKNGTKYSVDFWASIAVARHCQGFVGHFSSGLAHFIYHAMCFQHGRHTAQCPPGADIGNDRA